MKKLLTIMLALVLIMSLTVTAFAASGTNTDDGSISIENAHIDHVYTTYQILKLTSYDTDINSYIYEPANALWKAWIQDPAGGGMYLVLNENGTVKWNGTPTASTTKTFVAAALAYAEAQGMPNQGQITATSSSIKFENLNLGYYLVDSTAGALCSLDTVLPNAVLTEKNLIPKIEKKVEDANGNLGEEIVAKVGQIVVFDSKVTVYEGTHNFAYHDKMQEMLDYQPGSVEVYYAPVSAGIAVPASAYTVVESPVDGCTFCVEFTDAFMATITGSTEIHIRYKAELNEKAIVGGGDNVNKGRITYGDEYTTDWDPAVVKTYKFGIVKTNISNVVLEGAKFELYYEQTGGTPIPLVKEDPTSFTPEAGVNYYRPATADEIADPGFVSAEIEAGKAVLWGVRTGVTMYLQETQSPVGYNPLVDRVKIPALEGDNMPTFNLDGTYHSGGIEVENLAGAQLPQTGGIGTTLFYIFGGLMVVGAGVLLVTKKRMAA